MKRKPRFGEENEVKGDFKPKMIKKNHPLSLTNKDLKKRTKGGTTRVSREKKSNKLDLNIYGIDVEVVFPPEIRLKCSLLTMKYPR